ncbi:MAG: hypothetical protein FWC79_01420 [Oscillospiraceae bacterium]|nr:hypothetical protein [Oscillospiraceae bacterium]
MNEVIKKSKVSNVNLDVLLFPDGIGFNHRTGEYDQDAYRKIEEMNSEWYESLPGFKPAAQKGYIKINTGQMKNMHNKACKIVEENVKPYSGKNDIIVAINEYLAKNVDYDHTGNKTKLRMVDGNKGPLGATNGAFSAIVFNNTVCEGYTRGGQYLLKLKGIESRNVGCITIADTIYFSDETKEPKDTNYDIPTTGHHSIVGVNNGDGWYYCDPCINATEYRNGNKSLPYTLLTKEEISKTHTLSTQERKVGRDVTPFPRNEVAASIGRNGLFSNTRRANVDQAQADIGDKVYKGQILEGKDAK